jgi:hypothetical protein
MAMNVPLLPTQMHPTVPARKPSVVVQRTPRPWRGLPERAKAQLTAVVAEMVKRMASGAREDQNNAGCDDKS